MQSVGHLAVEQSVNTAVQGRKSERETYHRKRLQRMLLSEANT